MACSTESEGGVKRVRAKMRNEKLRGALETIVFGGNFNWFEDEKMAWIVMQLEGGGGGFRAFPGEDRIVGRYDEEEKKSV